MAQFISIRPEKEVIGIGYGLIGIIGFSFTLPATRIAVLHLDPVFVGIGRAIVAGVLAALLLFLAKAPLPAKDQLISLALVALGVIIGFPLFSAWALQSVPAIHGAIVIGILPLATLVTGVIRAGERPSRSFWLLSICGAAVVIAYALLEHAGSISTADLLLLGAVGSAAIGYTEGARLARSMGSWKVISWALVISVPFLIVPFLWVFQRVDLNVPVTAWFSFFYVCFISQFVAFFAWYKGLAMGGIARVGQVQLLQPFFTIILSAVLLGEQVDRLTICALLMILVIVWAGRYTKDHL